MLGSDADTSVGKNYGGGSSSSSSSGGGSSGGTSRSGTAQDMANYAYSRIGDSVSSFLMILKSILKDLVMVKDIINGVTYS